MPVLINKYITHHCKFCDGKGVIPPKKSWMPEVECYDCKGYGLLPNQDGKDILELFDIHRRKL